MVYKLGKVIGKGSDGVVYELLKKDNDDLCEEVIKFIQGDIFGIKNYIEYYILFNLDEKYITRCKKIEIDEDGLIKIIFKKAKSDLKDYIQKNNLTLKKKKQIMKKLLTGLEYLHSYNIIHGDIKPTNILLFDNLDIKYADFNLSTIYLNDEKIKKRLYTITYRPPEIKEGRASLKSDIWALGCTFFEIYYGYEYFNFSRDKNFFHMKNSTESRDENLLFNNLIEKMINSDEKSRISLENVKNHLFFKNEKFEEKFDKKEELNKEKYINILKTNFPSYNIKANIDEKIFMSKTYDFSRIVVHKNYKNIENKISKDGFKLNLFN